tara:strand:+ start:3885 stop:4016 length:132 start_codon:yes stop_codon:yes gene_type:complete
MVGYDGVWNGFIGWSTVAVYGVIYWKVGYGGGWSSFAARSGMT